MKKLFLTTASIAIAGLCQSGNLYARNTYPATHAAARAQNAAPAQNATQAPNASDLVNDAVKTVQR